MGREKTLELVAKKLKREPELQFRRKENKKQFTFNESVNNAQPACSRRLSQRLLKDTVILKNAKEQLQEGTRAIAERQKHIRLADRSDYGWQLVEAYQQADTLKSMPRKLKKRKRQLNSRIIKSANRPVLTERRRRFSHSLDFTDHRSQWEILVFHHPRHLCHLCFSQCHSL